MYTVEFDIKQVMGKDASNPEFTEYETKGEAEHAKKILKKLNPGLKVTVVVNKEKAKQALADHKEFLKKEKEKERILKNKNKADMIPVIDGQDPLAF